MPPQPEATYAADAVDIVFGGVKITGYGEDSFCVIKRNSALYATKVGADGSYARARLADRSVTVEITLLQTSPSNDYLTSMAILDRIGQGVAEFQVTNKLSPGELAHADRAWVQELPQTELQKEVGEKKWVFGSGNMQLSHGGNPGSTG